MADVILAALVLGPVVLTFFLRSNAALGFLALCAGFVAISFTGSDLKHLTGQLKFSINSSTLNLILLVAPLVLTLLIARKAFSGGMARIAHLVTALCTGVLLAVVAVPLLSKSARKTIEHASLYANLQKSQAAAIGAGIFLSLALIWAKNFKKGFAKEKKRK